MIGKGLSGLNGAGSAPSTTGETATGTPAAVSPASVASPQPASSVGPVNSDGLSLPFGLSNPATPDATPTDVVLYRLEADLNGDGQLESAQVLALDGNPNVNAPSRKQLQIVGANQVVQFLSESFEEPFHTDVDDTAESPAQKAGIHLVAAQPWPRLRLIFAARSGNFVDFQWNGQSYELAEVGD